MNVTKEQIKQHSDKNKLDVLLSIFIHLYEKDISNEEEKKLKSLVIAFNWAIYNFGINYVYDNPEVIKNEMNFQESINFLKEKIK